MNLRLCITAFAAFAALLLAASARADVTPNPLFTDHMVLQRDRPAPVWGTASPGEKVSVTFHGEAKSATAAPDGKWLITLPPQPLSTTPQTMTIVGNNRLAITDVLVGDVWLGTGQSNMAFTVNGTDGRDRVMNGDATRFRNIRLFKVPELGADTPQVSVDAKWEETKPGSIAGFSAVLFYFGEALAERQPGVPLGLVRSCVGATNAFSWIPNRIRDQDPSSAFLRQWYANASKSWTPEKQAAYEAARADYIAKVADYRSRKEAIPATLRAPNEVMGPKYTRRPSAYYNGMIAPLEPLAIRGAIWYQGEWDAKRDWVNGYHDTMLALASSWRADWATAAGESTPATFPFYIVQLPSRIPGDGDLWPRMREIQEKLATDIPNSGFVTTLDLNDGTNLHPPQKTEIGRRLARLALAREYGQKIAFHGPMLTASHIDGDKLVLTFDAGSSALKSADGQPLRNFELAGSDDKFFPATAEIRGGDVVVTSPQVPKPVTARYGYMPTLTSPNFYNSEDLPAVPFRTDSPHTTRLSLTPLPPLSLAREGAGG